MSGLELRDVTVRYGDTTALDGVSMAVAPGEVVALLGPSGSGESTLLRAIAGLARPVAGEIRWRGEPRRAGSPEWRSACLYEGHASGWKDSLEARENLALQAALDGLDVDAQAIDAQLARVGLERQARLPFVRLSAGQRRRLSLARLGLSRRPLWLLDEPFVALDAAAVDLVAGLIGAHLQRGGLAVLTTHQPVEIAAGTARQLVLTREMASC